MSEKEYIEREAALKAFEPQCGDWSECWSAEEIKPKLESIPAVDVVEVVRCSDCEYWDRNNEARLDRGCYFCSCFGGYTRPTFYCADGERKGGDE